MGTLPMKDIHNHPYFCVPPQTQLKLFFAVSPLCPPWSLQMRWNFELLVL